jgi:lauroyl/myristoyl acyltransferase
MSRYPQSVGDVALAAAVGGAMMVSRWLPPRTWRPLTRGLARVIGVAHPSAGRLASDAALAPGIECREHELALERLASGAESRLHGLGAFRAAALGGPAGFPIDVSGTERLATALAAGAGAILWVASFTWASLISKVALHDAGFAVTHLSRPTHGFGVSPFAIARLNPVWTRVEEQFLARRVVMEPGSESTGLRALRRGLSGNGLVSISLGSQGTHVARVPFPGGELRVATGAVTLASSCNAPLLPVFTGREPDGRFRVVVDAPLDLDTAASRRGLHEAAVRLYAARLEPWVRRWPGQWLG